MLYAISEISGIMDKVIAKFLYDYQDIKNSFNNFITSFSIHFIYERYKWTTAKRRYEYFSMGISIGATLAEVPFKKAVSQSDAWIYSVIKVIGVPAINFVLLLIVAKLGILPVSFVGMATTMLMMATPTATVAAAYAISYDREALFTSNCSLLSTVVAVVAMPVWIVVLEIIKNIGLFA